MLLPQRIAKSRAMAVLMVAVGLGLAGAGVWFAFDHARFLSQGERAEGTVTEIAAKRSPKGMILYHPVVTFSVPGRAGTVTFRSRTGLWPSPFAVGDKVEVVFDPAAPGHAKVVSFWTLWFLPACMLALGLLAVALGWKGLTKAR